MSGEELLSGDVILRQFGTNIRLREAITNCSPIIGVNHMIPQPGGKPFDSELLIPATGDVVAAVGAGDDERENDKDKK